MLLLLELVDDGGRRLLNPYGSLLPFIIIIIIHHFFRILLLLLLLLLIGLCVGLKAMKGRNEKEVSIAYAVLCVETLKQRFAAPMSDNVRGGTSSLWVLYCIHKTQQQQQQHRTITMATVNLQY